MSPSDFNFPPKFSSFREAQTEALYHTLHSLSRFRALALPVGSGKSLFAMLLAKHFNRTAILTVTKGLQQQYCLVPETAILTADLKYVSLGLLTVGDKLFGFDEYPDGTRRRWRSSYVLSTKRIILPCYRLTLEDGTQFTCSKDHQWLVRKSDGTMQWKTTASLRVGGKFASSICRLCDSWGYQEEYTTGYLAAAFDGEGHLASRQFTNEHGKVAAVALSYTQKPNAMFWEVIRCLEKRGFSYNLSFRDPDGCSQLSISGRREIMRFLGEIRPHRLLPKVDPDRFGMIGPIVSNRVVLKEFVGDKEVVALATSTGTFVAEGYGSHNCDDFSSSGLVLIKGRTNYLCDVADNCKLGGHLRCSSQRDERCPYVQVYNEAKASSHIVTNYAYWLNVMNKGQGLGDFDCLILDEAHDASKALSSYLDFHISEAETERFQLLPGPLKNGEDLPAWQRWAQKAEIQLKQHLTSTRSPHHRALEAERMESLLDRLARLQTIEEGNWVCELSEGTKYGRFWKFDCVWPGQYGEMLFQRIPNIILMSGTLRPKSLGELGIKKADADFRSWLRTFPPNRSPFYHIKSVGVRYGWSVEDEQTWLTTIDNIIESRHASRKGIIHTVSYARQRTLLERSRFRQFMVANSNDPDSEEASAVVERFRSMSAPAILVSPSFGTGWDFPLDECEWQIITNIPFPPMQSKVMKRRKELDPSYQSAQAAKELAQALGRPVRSEKDRAETFIVDDRIGWFVKLAQKFLPEDFNYISLLKVPDPGPRWNEK